MWRAWIVDREAALPGSGRTRVLAVDPVAFELLVVDGRLDGRSLGRAGLPAHDLVGLAAELAPLLPTGGPGGVGVGDLAGPLVEEVGLAVAVGVDAEVDRRDRGVAGLGRAEGLRVPRLDALDEVVPEGAGVAIAAWSRSRR